MSDVSIKDALEYFPALKDKFALSLVSQLNAAKEQARVQTENQGFVKEMLAHLTGSARRRQDDINTKVVNVLEQTLEQVTELIEYVTFTNRTLGLMLDELQNLQGHVEVIANKVVGIEERLIELDLQMRSRLAKQQEQLDEVDFRTQALIQVDRVINAWDVRPKSDLPVMIRAYSILEELWAGPFGYYVHQHKGRDSEAFLEDLRNRLKKVFEQELQIKSMVRVTRDRWFSESVLILHKSDMLRDAFMYMSDWSDTESAPFVSYLRGESGELVDLVVPHVMDAQRMSEALLNEVIVGRRGAL